MDKFEVSFAGVPALQEGLVVEDPRLAIRGKITIIDYWESFYAPLDAWRVEDYEAQWSEARRRLQEGAPNTCFVVSVHPRVIAAYFETWTIWRLAQEFRIQNRFFFLSEAKHVDPRNPYDAIGPYSNLTEEGEEIVDWALPLSAFQVSE